MMIPKNITQSHVLMAIKEIDINGIPKGRASKKYLLRYGKKFYPPKYTLGLANKYANNHELNPEDYSGGLNGTNSYLIDLGFKIIKSNSFKKHEHQTRTMNNSSERVESRHTENCSECKNTIVALLEEIYGKVEYNSKIDLGSKPEHFKESKHYFQLNEIYKLLQASRGHNRFVRAKALPQCDFYVPNPNFILEFDESQHFTSHRAQTLKKYPKKLNIGFDAHRWIEICENTKARDNSPPYRDEQRAWYDTLRDFMPEIVGMKPTIRLYAKDLKWCNLNPKNPKDVEDFKRILKGGKPKIEDWVATVLLESNCRFTNKERLGVLSKVIENISKSTEGNGIVLFPGGWFKAGKRKASAIYDWVGDSVSKILKKYRSTIVACVGIDGRITDEGWLRDQIGAAVSKKGIIAIGRKFHAVHDEKHYIFPAEDHNQKEAGYSRVFKLDDRKYFLCACYDGFGIKHRSLPKMGVDVILDLVHGFQPKGEGGSGDVYFAKNGFAGASKHWDCAVFGAAVFFNRRIPERWPSGVIWNKGTMATKYWRYDDNPLSPLNTFFLKIREGNAVIRIFAQKKIDKRRT